MASAAVAPQQVNGTRTPTTADDDELYAQLLQLRDAVIAGSHTTFKLPPSAIERLKASLVVPDAQVATSPKSPPSSGINGSAFSTNQSQLHQSSFASPFGLPGLQAAYLPPFNGEASPFVEKPSPSAGLDPIFLEKSDSLVRAEGKLKRQRLDRDLHAQVDQRKHSSRDRDPGAEAPSPLDIDLVLLSALERVASVSGLKKDDNAEDTSFDENDYYSSQVQSEWSSEESSEKGSDKAAGAFQADYERLDGAQQQSRSFADRHSQLKHPTLPRSTVAQTSRNRPHVYTNEPEDVYEVDDEDDDYTPPDASAFDSFRGQGAALDAHQTTPPEDDNSDYEPGEITDSNVPTPQGHVQQPAQQSPRVQVIRNHLTHIAAPQPNRVSPLATAKGSGVELELVNGRPEVVQKSQRHQYHSRVSTASPSGAGANGQKKRRTKKRKRDFEPAGRAKKRRERDRNVPSQASPALTYQEPYIKNEPISPPPFAGVQDAPQYQPYPQYQPDEVEIISPRHAPQMQYANEAPRSGLRYEYVQPTLPDLPRLPSPIQTRATQRDNQDLRRVASLHHAQRPHSPQSQAYSPVAPYHRVSMAYGESHVPPPGSPLADYSIQAQTERQRTGQQQNGYYGHMEPPQPQPRVQEYKTTFEARAASPAMPPPSTPTRRIVVDQYGNRYYAAEPAPAESAPPSVSRVSVAPPERHDQPDIGYERAPSRTSYSYATRPAESNQYEYSDNRMAPPPPPPPSRRQAESQRQVQYVDANGYPIKDFKPRPAEQVRYSEAPTSPVYQQVGRYDGMAPPPTQVAREPTSPTFSSNGYSSRPDIASQPQLGYMRHASVAPVQYVRQDAPPPPARAVSVMPGGDYGMPMVSQQRTYSQAPRSVRYVDQFGNDVYPREVRQVSEYRH